MLENGTRVTGRTDTGCENEWKGAKEGLLIDMLPI